MGDETNRNANYIISKLRLSPQRKLKDWRYTTSEEIRKLLGSLRSTWPGDQ